MKYHHFRSHVADGSVDVQAVSSEQQLADMLTKPNKLKDSLRHRKAVMGW